jgi:hypothetical protein
MVEVMQQHELQLQQQQQELEEQLQQQKLQKQQQQQQQLTSSTESLATNGATSEALDSASPVVETVEPQRTVEEYAAEALQQYPIIAGESFTLSQCCRYVAVLTSLSLSLSPCLSRCAHYRRHQSSHIRQHSLKKDLERLDHRQTTSCRGIE